MKMATQGIVSVVDTDTKKVLFKIIVGCNGYNAKKFSDMLSVINKKAIDFQMLLGTALTVSFGCKDCLVIMDENTKHDSHGEELYERYRRTFSDPGFNPRWDHGTADHSEILYV